MIDKQLLQIGGASETAINNLTAAWDAWQKAMGQPVHQLPHIVCTGIYNAGKSTLLNALFNAEKFPTGNIPTTKKVSQAEFNGAVYVDTPGLNADEQDDRETAQAYESADLYLFVSNAENGGIGEQESRWLKALKGRYADENALKHRLVYVLSQGDRLEPETLQRVLEQSRTDLQKVLGFCPEGAFCVDSHTYSDGKEQNEPILVEDSGIPQLRTFLGKWTAEFAARLENLHQSEVAACRREVLTQLDKMKVAFRQQNEQNARETSKQIQKIRNIWSSLEKGLDEIVPQEKNINPIGKYIFNFKISKEIGSGEIKERSASSVRSQLKDRLRGVRSTALYKCANDAAGEVRKYCQNGIDSAYFECCDRINNKLEECADLFSENGLKIDLDSAIEVEADIPNYLESQIVQILSDDSIICGSLSDCIDRYWNNMVYEDTDYKDGWFGTLKEIKYYRVSHLGLQFGCNVAEEMDRRSVYYQSKANDKINSVWKDFSKKLHPEVIKRKNNIKKQVDAYCTKLEKSSISPDVQKAQEYLARLQKEANV